MQCMSACLCLPFCLLGVWVPRDPGCLGSCDAHWVARAEAPNREITTMQDRPTGRLAALQFPKGGGSEQADAYHSQKGPVPQRVRQSNSSPKTATKSRPRDPVAVVCDTISVRPPSQTSNGTFKPARGQSLPPGILGILGISSGTASTGWTPCLALSDLVPKSPGDCRLTDEDPVDADAGVKDASFGLVVS
ncbi:hypothetical protein F5144DRAFT_543006 [Chaetomium tenue]|uniref:Uncharacterized protein n=1 Tax=Chaetomium tenue TaxID=1854479 RepID=A0ACB7PRS0_9PEZI|nr:hypothetical protein F5144DRAFT_543006 [Chaetomium globosum]